MTNARGSS